jgi:hypothetical protein
VTRKYEALLSGLGLALSTFVATRIGCRVVTGFPRLVARTLAA